MDASSIVSAANPAIDDAAALARGVARMFALRGFSCVAELSLANGRRADLLALGPKGELTVIEIKSSLADFRADAKWPDYVGFCDTFFFAVGPRFPRDLIPEEAGLIVADAYGGEILRPAPERPVKPARRKAVTLRFAHAAANRVNGVI